MDPDIRRVDQHLKRSACVYTPSWLQECVEYYKSEASGALNLEELCAQVLGQWCLLDLCELSIPSLPPQLASKAKFQLTGSYTLQVNVATDISTSAYTQYQKIRNTDIANLDIDEERNSVGPKEPRAKRMMRLSLTDGVQVVSAVEHQPIKLFDRTLLPGCKVMVKGPVISRRGILFLCGHNITLLGGEVDSLLVPNALENVVARKLGLPENPDPYRLEQPNAVLNVAAPAAVQDEWGDDLWEEDLVQQLPEILNAADANHSSNNPRNNVGNNANSNPSTSSYGNRVNTMGNHQNNTTFPSSVSATANHANINRTTETSGNWSSGRQNTWSSDRKDPTNNGWNAAGWTRTEGNSGRVNTNVTTTPSNGNFGGGDWGPSPQKQAGFTLSDSEDELLQAVDVEAAIRMTQMVRPITNHPQVVPPIDSWNRTDVGRDRIAQPNHNENRACRTENWPTEEDMEESEFQPPVSRRDSKWLEEDEEDMDFEPQTSFPRRNEDFSPERVAFYQPTKPRSRQEAFEELRAKRLRAKATAGSSLSENNLSAPKDVVPKNPANKDRDVAPSTKPTCSRYDVDQDSRTLRSEYFDAEPSAQMKVDTKSLKSFKPEPLTTEPFELEPLKSESLEPDQPAPEPMDTVPDTTEPLRSPVTLAAEPFVYLNAVDVGQRGERYVVKATVLQLRSSLKAEGGRWHLDAEIADGSSATLVIRFANAVLETLIGYSVAEMATLKKQIATNPLIKERICEDLQQARQRLVDLNCLMTLEVSEDASVTVVALTQINEAHQQSLVGRNSRITNHK